MRRGGGVLDPWGGQDKREDETRSKNKTMIQSDESESESEVPFLTEGGAVCVSCVKTNFQVLTR